MAQLPTQPLVVAERRELTTDVTEVTLVHPDGQRLPGWEPGAHVELRLTPELARQYSLCGDPARPAAWTIAVLREPEGRGGSQYVHDKLAVGTTVDVSAVRNHFTLEPAADYLFVAGGIGITPIRPMLAAATRAGASWRLVYGGRTRASMAYADELRTGYGRQVELWPQDERGLIDLPAVLGEPRAGRLVYCCGPEPLLHAVEQQCARHPAGTLHLERFSARALDAAADDATDDGFDVELDRSATVVRVPAGTTILAAVEAAGADVLSSCLEGICGTCETRVLGGAIEHRDSYLTDEERAAGDVMMICVSRAAGPKLTLDL